MFFGFVILASLAALFASALTQLFMGYQGRLRATGFALIVTFFVTLILALLLDGIPRSSSRFFEMLILIVPITIAMNVLILIPILIAKAFSFSRKK
jgi:hypothetical protein